MTHGYSLRPHAKGRRGQQSTGNPDSQVEGPIDGTDEGHYPRAALNTAVPAQNLEHQRTEERSHGIPSPIGNTIITTHLDLGRFTIRSRLVTEKDIQASRQREEARRCADECRIRREQIQLGHERDRSALRARIVALREECKEEVARVQRKWAHEIEVGELVMMEEDGEVRENWE